MNRELVGEEIVLSAPEPAHLRSMLVSAVRGFLRAVEAPTVDTDSVQSAFAEAFDQLGEAGDAVTFGARIRIADEGVSVLLSRSDDAVEPLTVTCPA